MRKSIHFSPAKNSAFFASCFTGRAKLVIASLLVAILTNFQIKASGSAPAFGSHLGKGFLVSDEWTLLRDTLNVQVYYKLSSCQSAEVNPLNLSSIQGRDEVCQLKVVNKGNTISELSFPSEVRKSGSSSSKTIKVSALGSYITTCEESTKVILTKSTGDDYPLSLTNFLKYFNLTITN